MIDFYRKSILSQLGKDAGNQSMSDFIRNINSSYDKYLSGIKEQKEKPTVDKSEDFGLYL